MVVADLASSATAGGAIAVILWLAVSHHLSLAAAAAGTAALVVLGQRIAFAGQSAGMLQEAAMFIDDFIGFAALASAGAAPSAAPPDSPHPPEPPSTPDPGAEITPSPKITPSPGEPMAVGSIADEDVTFSYPGSERVSLRAVSLLVPDGPLTPTPRPPAPPR